jgi:hypothetical protein
MMTMIYELASASGATTAFFVFLLLSLGISLVLYAVILRRTARHALFQGGPTLPAPLAALLCAGVFGLLFGAMYGTTLQGFYRVELLDGEVRLHYLFPAHTVTLSRIELVQAERVRAHKGRGHLRLRTHEGVTYESALANDRAVLESWQGLNAYLDDDTGQP